MIRSLTWAAYPFIKVNTSLGGGAYMNRLTTGVAPDLLAEDQVGWVVDLHYRRPMGGFTVLLSGQFMETSTEAVDVPNEPKLTARGYHGAAGFELPMGLRLPIDTHLWTQPPILKRKILQSKRCSISTR